MGKICFNETFFTGDSDVICCMIVIGYLILHCYFFIFVIDVINHLFHCKISL